jgi:DNA primase
VVKSTVDSQVEEIKKKIDIVTLINKYLPLKKRGRHFLACCPFHGEKTPSFTVSPELQIFKCFGCGKAGDIFTFLQEFEKIDFKEALEILAKMAGVKLKKSFEYNKEELKRKKLLDLNHQIARFYNYILLHHRLGQNALNYLVSRGIKKEIITKFQIGYSPAEDRLITNFLKKQEFTKTDLVASGNFVQSSYGNFLYDRFKNRVIFPLTDSRGQILGFSGRVLPTAGPNMAKYINSPETSLYHKSHLLFGLFQAREAIRKENFVIITEGEFDMIAPFQKGVQNIVAIKGTAFTKEQLNILRRFTDTLVLGLDSDFAGSNAALKSIELADSLEFDIKVLVLGEKYKDPDEAVNGDLDFFKKQIKNAIPVWDFIINYSVKKFGIDTPKGKKEILKLVLPFLIKITNSVIKSDYLRKLADILRSDLSSVLEELGKYGNVSNNLNNKIMQEKESKPILRENLEKKLLILIFGANKPNILAKKISDDYKNFITYRFSLIFNSLVKSKKFKSDKFTEKLKEEVKNTYYDLYFLSTNNPLDKEIRKKEIAKVINQLQTLVIKEEINNLSEEISIAENSGNTSTASKLDLRLNELLSRLSKLQIKKR